MTCDDSTRTASTLLTTTRQQQQQCLTANNAATVTGLTCTEMRSVHVQTTQWGLKIRINISTIISTVTQLLPSFCFAFMLFLSWMCTKMHLANKLCPNPVIKFTTLLLKSSVLLFTGFLKNYERIIIIKLVKRWGMVRKQEIYFGGDSKQSHDQGS